MSTITGPPNPAALRSMSPTPIAIRSLIRSGWRALSSLRAAASDLTSTLSTDGGSMSDGRTRVDPVSGPLMIDDPHVELQPAFGEHRDHELPQPPLYIVPVRHAARAVSRDIEHESDAQRAAGLRPSRRRARGMPAAGSVLVSGPRFSHFSHAPET